MADKIVKSDATAKPTEVELEVAQFLTDLENSPGSDLKSDLKDFKIAGAKEIECPGVGGKTPKNAIVIFTPYAVYREAKTKGASTGSGVASNYASNNFLSKLIRELEKKVGSKKHIIIVANRTILDKNFRRKGIKNRPRTRTLTSVHESILEDVVFPSEITGKRTRISTDGSKLLKVFLDKKDKETVDEKLHVFTEVYKTLTNKEAQFIV
jgi:small subunit ribosomal protein S7e